MPRAETWAETKIETEILMHLGIVTGIAFEAELLAALRADGLTGDRVAGLAPERGADGRRKR